MKNCIFVQLLLTLLFFSQVYAQFDVKNYDPTVKFINGVKIVKRTYLSIEGQWFSELTVFKYDNQSRLIRSTKYNGVGFKNIQAYTIYNYCKNGNLLEKTFYNKEYCCPDDFRLLSKIRYTYCNGLLVSENELCPKIGDNQQIKYEYQNNHLVSKKYYVNNAVEHESIFKYENNRIVCELSCTDGEEKKDTIKHIYTNDTLAEVQFCNGFGVPFKIAHYVYNKYGKIISINLTHSPAFSVGSSYVETYDY